MGADFICAYIPAAQIDEARQRRLLEIVAAEEPHAWDDYGYDSPEDCRKAIADAVEYLTGLPNRETAVVDFPGSTYSVLLTGGMSWGDLPTDACEVFDTLILHAPAVVEQLEQWAKEDRRAAPGGSTTTTEGHQAAEAGTARETEMTDLKERMKKIVEGLSPDEVGSLLAVINDLYRVTVFGWLTRVYADYLADDRWGRKLTDEEWYDFAGCMSDDDYYCDTIGNWFADNEPEEEGKAALPEMLSDPDAEVDQ